MAFIRQYAAGYYGDPFSFRIPKKLRKLKVGRALGRVARAGLSFVPGGGAISSVLGMVQRPSHRGSGGGGLWSALLGMVENRYGTDVAEGFARAYGIEPDMAEGDPGPRVRQRGKGPAPKPAQKRKAAASGTKQKAARKRAKRSGGIDLGGIIKEHAGTAITATAELGKALLARDPARAMSLITSSPDQLDALVAGMGKPGGKLRLPGMGGRRRSINPANVKALRRSMRRLEGFEKLVKRVDRMFPKMARAHRASRSGHASGCRCIACRKRAA